MGGFSLYSARSFSSDENLSGRLIPCIDFLNWPANGVLPPGGAGVTRARPAESACALEERGGVGAPPPAHRLRGE